MARRQTLQKHHGGRTIAWSSVVLLGVLLLIAAMVFAIWRSGLLAARPNITQLRLRDLAPPTQPAPNPQPLPAPGPRPR